MNKIAAVIVLYNTDPENIKFVVNNINKIRRIYLIDNSEIPDVCLMEYFSSMPDVRYIRNFSNKGIAYALNQGAELAIADGFDWLMTLDQDSKPDYMMIEGMVRFIKKHHELNIGIVSPRHKLLFSTQENALPEYEEKIEVMTSGNLLNLDAFKKTGHFMDELFIDSVDHEYCFRLLNNGYRVIQLNKITMEHELGDRSRHLFIYPVNLFKKNKSVICYKISNNHNYIRKYYIIRNRLYVSFRYRKDFPEFRKKMLKSILDLLVYIVLYESDKGRKLRSCILGFIDYYRGNLGKREFKNF